MMHWQHQHPYAIHSQPWYLPWLDKGNAVLPNPLIYTGVRPRRGFSRDELIQFLDYNSETGVLTWVKRTSKRVDIGMRAGTHSHGYCAVKIFGLVYRAHQLAWLIMTGEWPEGGADIDHINRDRFDNRWANLRLATRSQNNMNSGLRSDNKSGVKGVSLNPRGKWDSRIRVKGEIILLGTFSDISDAIHAREGAEKIYFGEFCPQGGD